MPDDTKIAELTPQREAAAPKETVEPVKAASHDAVIDTWFRDHFAGSALGATTELYNAGHSAKEDLKKRLSH